MQAELESLLPGLYTGTAEGMGQLQSLRARFMAQPDAPLQAKTLIQGSTNQYVLWFSITIFEDMLRTHAWETLPFAVQTEFRDFFFSYIIASYKNLPPFVANKLAKVYVDIGKADWPHAFPSFLPNVIQALQTPACAAVGVYLITLISEEFITSQRDDVPASRRRDLRANLSSHLPIIVGQLAQIMDALFTQNTRKIESATPNEEATYTSGFDGASLSLAQSCLSCMHQLFTWIPLAEILVPSGLPLTTLFHYMQLTDPQAEALSVAALTCVNEILARNYVPRDFQDFLVLVFRQIFGLLTKLTTGAGGRSTAFIERFTEFASLFVTNHLKRVENNPLFPMMDFLVLFFKFTFMQGSLDGFLACLDIWGTFLDYLIEQWHHTQEKTGTLVLPEGAEPWARYKAGMMAMATELLGKTMWAHNHAQLASLGSDETDSELDSFVTGSQRIMGKVAELFPAAVLEMAYPILASNVEKFCTVHQLLAAPGTQEQMQTMMCTIKDTAQLLRLFGLLAEHFVMDFDGKFAAATSLVTVLCNLGTYAVTNQLAQRGPELLAVQCELLGTLRAFTQWLSLAVFHPIPQEQTTKILADIFTIITNLLQMPATPNVALTAAGTLLQSLTASVRPPMMLSLVQVLTLVDRTHDICASGLPLPIQTKVYVGTMGAILFATTATWSLQSAQPQQQPPWAARVARFAEFMRPLTTSLAQVPQIPGFSNEAYAAPEVMDRVVRILTILQGMVAAVKTENNQVKAALYDTIQEVLPLTLSLFRIYTQHTKVLRAILEFFLAVFESLWSQAGPSFAQQTISTFLEVLQGDTIARVLRQEDASGTAVVNNLVLILILLVQGKGAAAEALLPAIVAFVMDQLFPHILNNFSSEITSNFYQLLTQSLLSHWKLFDVNGLLGGRTPALLAAYERSFQQPDVSIFGANLEALQELNTKLNLFQRQTFVQTGFSFSLLRTVINVLLAKTHNLLRDEILGLIYHVAAVNFDSFFDGFLPMFLQHTPGLRPDQSSTLLSSFTRDKDQPTFHQNMNNFVTDASYYIQANLPPESK